MLPLALLDLTLSQSRLMQHASLLRPTSLVKSFARTSHALAVQTNRALYPGPSNVQYNVAPRLPERHEGITERNLSHSLSSPNRAPSHPAALVRNLVEELIALPVTESRTLEGPIYGEDDLQQIYADLLASPVPDHDGPFAINEPTSQEEVKLILKKVARRLQLFESSVDAGSSNETSLAQKLYVLHGGKDDGVQDIVLKGERGTYVEIDTNQKPLHKAILSRLDLVARGVAESSSETTERVPVLILSLMEWKALVRECVSMGDQQSAEKVLSLMHSLDVSVPESVSDDILRSYASTGNVAAVLKFISRFVDGEPTELQRDRLVKAHLNSTSPKYNVGTALQAIHEFESRGLAPQMKTYTRAIVALFRTNTSACRAQGWDLFAHMRYVAHPQPDEFLYGYMIRACGFGTTQSSIWVQPERALDLWQELRSFIGEGVLPSVYAYNSIISVCARSREFSGEAFRLAREMLDAQRDAFGRPLLRPTRNTFRALLTAAKTRGDLSRVRWILAEILSTNAREEGSGDGKKVPLVNEDIMVHVLHAYASYKPPFVRSSTRIFDEKDAKPSEEIMEGGVPQMADDVREAKGSFSSIPPQTSGEVIAEARLLFEHIVEDRTQSMDGESLHSPTGHFKDVELTTRLLNSYMAVHCQHNSIGEVQKLFYGSSGVHNEKSLYERLGVECSLRSFVETLERCAFPRDHLERKVAWEFAERLWVDAQRIIGAGDGPDPCKSFGTEARWVERTWAAMIRMMASAGNLDRAMDLLRSFTKIYHPSLVRSTSPELIRASDVGRSLTSMMRSQSLGLALPNSMLSTRVSLFADRPLVRLTSPADDVSTRSGLADTTPPLLSFSDLELLHHRLVCEGLKRRKDIAYLKWVCSAYKGALKKRWESAVSTRMSNDDEASTK